MVFVLVVYVGLFSIDIPRADRDVALQTEKIAIFPTLEGCKSAQQALLANRSGKFPLGSTCIPAPAASSVIR